MRQTCLAADQATLKREPGLQIRVRNDHLAAIMSRKMTKYSHDGDKHNFEIRKMSNEVKCQLHTSEIVRTEAAARLRTISNRIDAIVSLSS
ncbi:hypothetical protein [Bradyrhizobium sp. CCBAU 51627]|uniref:hypothetical protein n=1 Tax=Bradyrhizobium sp. CCBAU 51627 TaxID=1325088 RepID=UPI0023069367|nr:hypothetical protein [Bradyrhizobium sp. CCBAU 51627]